MSAPIPDEQELRLNYLTLATLRGDDAEYSGPLDSPCPLCGPSRPPETRMRPVLRSWKPSPGFISFHCARCEASGYASAGDIDAMDEPPPSMEFAKPVKPHAVSSGDISGASRLWDQARSALPASVQAYFKWRGIELKTVPKGVLRFHPKCPWKTFQTGCVLARFSDALSGEERGIWRRIVQVGVTAIKPMTLGPMAGCVIRLFPEVGKRLVVGEGIETVLAAATRLSYRGKPLRPAWATGSAGNLRRLPVLDGVEQLVILVDHDESGTGQAAAEECAARWIEAGRAVVRLMPKRQGTDFNDLVRS